jgi:putative membrane protein
MADTPDQKPQVRELDAPTRLAFDRTYLAYETTQLAWVRTSLGLISFGFTIAKFFDYLHDRPGEYAPRYAPRAVGLIMIVIGLLTLALASWQHTRAIRALRKEHAGIPKSLAGVSSVFLAVLGMLALLGALVRI